VRRIRDSEKYTFIEITISEGRNRQVRRMVEALGAQALKLVRTAIGPLRLGALPIGHWRTLTADEVRMLKRAGGPARVKPPGGDKVPRAKASGRRPR
jgi:16S rRNA U516 pseudouridylate synthase RsuA-like enzyme